MKKLIGLIACLMLFGLSSIFAQSKTVTGVVTDQSGVGLPGVSVSVQGTNEGTSTDIDGKWTLSVNANDVILISFVGMKPQEFKVGDKTTFTTVLEEDRVTVDEVVVTAIGIKRSQKSLGYAATTVKSDELTKSSPIDVMSGIKGKVAGVQISSNSGAPGASSKVILRGYSSVGGSNQPLYVIDGVPLNNSTAGTGGLNDAVDFGNRAADINPDDIESMSILKGASATGLYGSRASNGVIMITTKKGKANGKLNISISSSFDVSQVANLPDLQNEFGQGWDAVWRNDENGSWGPRFDGKVRPWGYNVDNSQLIKPFVAQKDNVKEFFDLGITYNNSVSLSGGNDKTSFFASFSNVTADGFIPTDVDEYIRNTASLRASHKVNEKLKMSASANYVVKVASALAVGQGMQTSGEPMMAELWQVPRDFSYLDMKNYKKNFYDYKTFYTPYASNPYEAIGENQNKQRENRFYGNFGLTYEILEGLSLNYKIGTDIANTHVFQSSAPFNYAGTPRYTKKNIEGGVMEKERYNSEVNSDLLLTYSKDLNEDFDINALVGWNVNQRDYRSSFILVKNLDIPDFYHITNSATKPEVAFYSERRRLYGVFGQIDVGYKDFLFFNAVARNDWSSTLPVGENSFFYPGVSLSLILTEALPIKGDIISFAKLRASWGKTGKDAGPYSLYNTLNQSSIGLGFGSLDFPMQNPHAEVPVNSWEVSNRLANNSIKPEITTEYEFGADIRLFDSRLGFDFAYYNKSTVDQITAIEIPASSGYTSRIANLGEVRNSGIELAVTLVPVQTDDFNWNMVYTFTTNDSEVVSLIDGVSKLDLAPLNGIEFRAEVGKPLGVFYGPDMERDDKGNIVVNGEDGMPIQAKDNVYYGDANYDFTMGLNNSFSYKGLTLGFSLDWRQGGYMFSRTAYNMLFTGNGELTTYNNRETFIIPGSVTKNTDGTYSPNTVAIGASELDSDFWPQGFLDRAKVIDKSFLKLREVTLGYQLPKHIAKKFYLDRMYISVYGKNLITIRSEENKYVDPEGSTFGNDLTSEYGEYSGMPSSRNYGVSLKLNF
jgi:TonB-linked SusC/RagA family outer membrane protein